MTKATQRAAYLWHPERAGSYVDIVEDVAELVGRPLDEAQREAVDCLTSHDRRGDWLTLEDALLEPRQNGKTAGVVTPIVLADLFVWGADRIAWTAQLFKTSREAFADIRQLIESCPDFDREVARVSEAHGEESIRLKSGAALDFLARGKMAGRGLGGKRVVVDEALFFSDEQAGSLLPIMAARRNPKVTFASSAAKVESNYLRRLVKRGRAGGDESLCYVEHCAPGSLDKPGCSQGEDCRHLYGTAGCVLDDPAYWRAANPAFGDRVSASFLAAMRRSMAPLEFAREFLGWHEAGADEAERPITVEAWGKLANPHRIDGPVAFGLWVSYDLARSALAVAGRSGPVVQVEVPRRDGEPDHRRGYGWLPERCRELAGRYPGAMFAYVPKAVPTDLVAALEAYGVPLEPLTAGEWSASCKALEAAVTSDPPTLTHHGDPILDGALAAAAIRPRDDGGWVWWQLDSAGDISALCAATLAHGRVAAGAVYDLLDSVL